MAMDMFPTEVLVAFSGLAGAIATAVIAGMKIRLEGRKLQQAEREIRFQRAALGFPEFVSEWDEINKELAKLMSETEVDRILIFRAWNGHLEPRWTTAVFQMRSNGTAPVSYVHFELDDDYVQKIRQIVQRGPITMVTTDMLPSKIKSVYEAEGVKSSLWAHLDTFQTTDGEGKAIAYCSFSSTSGAPLLPHTATRCGIIISRLKGLAGAFDRNEIL
jgi:hypothetical protein